jgi:hypothetical protein
MEPYLEGTECPCWQIAQLHWGWCVGHWMSSQDWGVFGIEFIPWSERISNHFIYVGWIHGYILLNLDLTSGLHEGFLAGAQPYLEGTECPCWQIAQLHWGWCVGSIIQSDIGIEFVPWSEHISNHFIYAGWMHGYILLYSRNVLKRHDKVLTGSSDIGMWSECIPLNWQDWPLRL